MKDTKEIFPFLMKIQYLMWIKLFNVENVKKVNKSTLPFTTLLLTKPCKWVRIITFIVLAFNITVL